MSSGCLRADRRDDSALTRHAHQYTLARARGRVLLHKSVEKHVMFFFQLSSCALFSFCLSFCSFIRGGDRRWLEQFCVCVCVFSACV